MARTSITQLIAVLLLCLTNAIIGTGHVDQQQNADDDHEDSSYDTTTINDNEQQLQEEYDVGMSGERQLGGGPKLNLLFIVCDQLRFDTIGWVQSKMLDRYPADKQHVHTPNIDHLMNVGAWFETAYCASPSCGPSRTSLLTGNTMQRTGIVGNKMIEERYYERMKMFRDKVLALESFEQILVDKMGYQAESYGKWHVPSILARSNSDSSNSKNNKNKNKNKNNIENRNRNRNKDRELGSEEGMDDKEGEGEDDDEEEEQDDEELDTIDLMEDEELERRLDEEVDDFYDESNFTATGGNKDSKNKDNTGSRSLNRVIMYNNYDFEKERSTFSQSFNYRKIYNTAVDYLLKRDRVSISYKYGQQENYYSGYPYDPIAIDPRFNSPTKINLSNKYGYESYQSGSSNICGRDVLTKEYTRTAVQGKMGLHALERLAEQYRSEKKPFSLSVHFSAPHPPMVAEGSYLDKYWGRQRIMVPNSIKDNLQNTAYMDPKLIQKLDEAGYGYDNEDEIRELTAVYYAMIEEVDTWVGDLLKVLYENKIEDNTLVVFTADHGEMLGAHGRLGKGMLLEEATRVPLVMSLPGRISPATIKLPVSQVDIFATILDYLGGSGYDQSDGTSLRRYMEKRSYNQFYDERIAVVESDNRIPEDDTHFKGKLGDEPNFMIRHKQFILIVPKRRDSDIVDTLYNIDKDPDQLENLLGQGAYFATDVSIGKAEHLKILLVEWMKRNDGRQHFFSDPKYNLFVGEGDIAETLNRRTWRRLDYWQSDSVLEFGTPTVTANGYQRNEFFYIGRSTPGILTIREISVRGPDRQYFSVDKSQAVIYEGQYIRVKVSFLAPKKLNFAKLNAFLFIVNGENGVQPIRIVEEAGTEIRLRRADPTKMVEYVKPKTPRPTHAPTEFFTDAPTANDTLAPTIPPAPKPTHRPVREPRTPRPTRQKCQQENRRCDSFTNCCKHLVCESTQSGRKCVSCKEKFETCKRTADCCSQLICMKADELQTQKQCLKLK